MTQYSYLQPGQTLGLGDSVISSVAQIALSSAKHFKEDYLELSRSIFESRDVKNELSHAGEFGRFREKLLQSLLQQFLPNRLRVGDGFLVPFLDRRSTQCDALIYDKDTSPQIASSGGLVMFPLEVCAAVGEVKSSLTFAKAGEALEKLSQIKRMRCEMPVSSLPAAPTSALLTDTQRLLEIGFKSGSFNSPDALKEQSDAIASLYDPKKNEQQALVTFLICEEIVWPSERGDEGPRDALEKNIKALMKNTVPHLRPNFILSLKQGFLSYFFSVSDTSSDAVNRIPYPYPVQTLKRVAGVEDDAPTDCGFRWLASNDDHRHIMQFVSEVAIAASRVPIYPFTAQAHSLDPKAFAYDFFTGN